MTYIGNKDLLLEVAKGLIDGQSIYQKFGANTDVDTGSTPEDMWLVGGEYTGFNATAGEAITFLSNSGQDGGTLVRSGTSTGGSATTIEDSGAAFIAIGVKVGDVVLNDTDQFHGIIKTLTSETELEIWTWDDGGTINETRTMEAGKAYRIATTVGTGVAVIKATNMLETDRAVWISEYVILAANSTVDSVGTDYVRGSRAFSVLAGSGGGAVSSISGYQKTTTANLFWSISIGHDQTLVACDTCPKGKTIYIKSLSCKMARSNGSSGSAEVDFFVRPIGQVFNSKIHEYISNSDRFATPDGYLLKITEYSDFKWSIPDVSDNDTQLSAQIIGITQDNE